MSRWINTDNWKSDDWFLIGFMGLAALGMVCLTLVALVRPEVFQ